MAERVDIGCKRLQIDGGPRPARLREKLRSTEQLYQTAYREGFLDARLRL